MFTKTRDSQEAIPPPTDLAIGVDDAPWKTAGAGLTRNWRTAVARISPRASVKWRAPLQLEDAQLGELGVSRLGTLSVADVELPNEPPITVVSMYAPWEKPVTETGSSWIFADASAHRLVSDISFLIGQQNRHRIIAAGDLNVLFGHGEDGSPYWARRYATVFDCMSAIGLRFVGPQSPDGQQASPRPAELPEGSKNVPTFRPRRDDPKSATRQLDFVFASESIASRVKTRALNADAEWRSSDHCLVRIELTD